MEDVVAGAVDDERICPVLKEIVDYVVVTPLCGPHGWSSMRLSTLSIDVCAGFDEECAGRILIVDGRPL